MNRPIFHGTTATIAPILVNLAKQQNTISYSKLGGEVGCWYNGMSAQLDSINMSTKEKCGVLLSVLVVYKNPPFRPASYFFDKWGDGGDHKEFFQKECRRVFQAARDGKLDYLISDAK